MRARASPAVEVCARPTISPPGPSAGVQLPPEYAGDGFADVVWQYNAAQNRVEIWADANDDGQMSEVDMVIYLSGATSLIQSDLADNFFVWRGTAGNDS